MRSEWCLLCLLLTMIEGCSVNIHGTTPSFIAPSSVLNATAKTERLGVSPTGVTLDYTHLRDEQTSAPASRAVGVTSAQDDHTGVLTPQGSPEFAVFDRVTLNWRVTYNAWGQTFSNGDSETVVINPGMSLTVSPESLPAGDTGTGLVSIVHPRSAGDIVVSLDTGSAQSSDSILNPGYSNDSRRGDNIANLPDHDRSENT